MKRLTITLALFIAGSCLADIAVSNLFTYAAVNNTSNNSSAVLIGTAYISTVPTISVQSGGLTDTNALTVYVQYGLNTNTYATVATYKQVSTNAQDGTVSPSGITLNIYARTAIVTTNNVSVGTKAIFNR